MKRILLYMNRECFYPVDYSELPYNFNKYGGNTGNRLFCHALEKYLLQGQVPFDYLSSEMTVDQINADYESIVFPLANIFSMNKEAQAQMAYYAEVFSKYKIPVYAIGAGAQARSYDELKELATNLKPTASPFIRAIYNTGGQLALRGYFTEEVLNRMGFRDAVVTGCPSLYQNGREFKVLNNKVEEKDFKPLVNGTIRYLGTRKVSEAFDQYPYSLYLDQDQFLQVLYGAELTDYSLKALYALVKKYSHRGIMLLAQDRIKLFADIPQWMDYIRRNANFSFGQRIHGNIIALLSGIPAAVHQHDSRTRELAEFFDIPVFNEWRKNDSLYDIYLKCDFNKFNESFSDKFDNFEKFLKNCNIVDNLKKLQPLRNDEFYSFPQVVNQDYFQRLTSIYPSCRIRKHFLILKNVYRLLGALTANKKFKDKSEALEIS